MIFPNFYLKNHQFYQSEQKFNLPEMPQVKIQLILRIYQEKLFSVNSSAHLIRLYSLIWKWKWCTVCVPNDSLTPQNVSILEARFNWKQFCYFFNIPTRVLIVYANSSKTITYWKKDSYIRNSNFSRMTHQASIHINIKSYRDLMSWNINSWEKNPSR